MESGAPRVCIVVAEPRDGSTLETVAALERLGSGAHVVRTHDARECLAYCETDDDPARVWCAPTTPGSVSRTVNLTMSPWW